MELGKTGSVARPAFQPMQALQGRRSRGLAQARVLIRDRALAASVTSHFQGLIDRESLKPLPAR